MSYSQRSTASRLLSGYGVMWGFLLLVIAIGLSQLIGIGHASRDLLSTEVVRERASRQWNAVLSKDALIFGLMVSTNDPDKRTAFQKQIADDKQTLDQIKQSFAGMSGTSATLADILKADQAYVNAEKSFVDALASGSTDYANSEFYGTLIPAVQAYQKRLEDFAHEQQQSMDSGGTDISNRISHAITLILALGAVAVVLSVAGAWRLVRSIRSALTSAVQAAHTIADGNLCEPIRTDITGDLGQLLNAQEKMRDRLQQTLNSIQMGADEVHLAASEIAQGNMNLSQRTEQRSAAIQSTTTAMGHVTQSVAQAAESSQTASRMASQASAEAEQRGQQLAELAATMENMAKSTGKIEEITRVIDSIAFQTNILALNAAVEAARAGEQGRGFAVVAGEVRNLAQRSVTASQEIRQLIEESVRNINAGANMATSVGGATQELIRNIRNVAQMLQATAASYNAQSADLANIDASIGALDQTAQQDAAMVEQVAAAANGLMAQAQQLRQAIGVFQFSASEPVSDARLPMGAPRLGLAG